MDNPENQGDDTGEFTFAVGIVTYRRPDCLERALTSLLDQTRFPDELIIIDDSETDTSADVVAELRPTYRRNDIEVTYRHYRERSGMPEARNEVIELASSDVVCFVDDDVVCPREWLASIAEGYNQYPDAVGVGGPAIATTEDLEPVYDIVRSENNLNIINKYGETDDMSERWIPPSPLRTDQFRGANMSFKRSALVDISGFDTDYGGPALFEETDLMARLKQRGMSLIYHPGARVNHIQASEGGARAMEDQQKASHGYWYARNSILFRKKNFDDVYYRSLLRLLLHKDFTPPAIYVQLYQLIINRDRQQLQQLRGYLDGILFEDRN